MARPKTSRPQGTQHVSQSVETPSLAPIGLVECVFQTGPGGLSTTFRIRPDHVRSAPARVLEERIGYALMKDRDVQNGVRRALEAWHSRSSPGETLCVAVWEPVSIEAVDKAIDAMWRRLAEQPTREGALQVIASTRHESIGLLSLAESATTGAVAKQEQKSKAPTQVASPEWYKELAFAPRPEVAAGAERLAESVRGQLHDQLRGVAPEDFSKVFAIFAATLAGVQAPIVQALQQYLDEVQGQLAEAGSRGFGDSERNTLFARELRELLYRLDMRLECPSCGSPSILRLLANKSETGSFEHFHDQVGHTASIKLPPLTLRPARTEPGPRVKIR